MPPIVLQKKQCPGKKDNQAILTVDPLQNTVSVTYYENGSKILTLVKNVQTKILSLMRFCRLRRSGTSPQSNGFTTE